MAKAIAKRELRLLCPHMCLAPILTNNPKDADLKGIGTIEITPRGGLRYHMAYEQVLPMSHWHNLGIPPTHIESIDELYRLVAIDSAGREWRSTPVRGRFYPKVDLPERGEVEESIDAISYSDLQPPNHDPSVILIFSEFPGIRSLLSGWTRQVHTRGEEQVLMKVSADHCQYQTEGCDVYIEYTDDDLLIVEVIPQNAEMVPIGFERRIIDAFTFIVGQRFSPVLSLRTQAKHMDWYITRGPYIEPKGMITSPVLSNRKSSQTNIWSLAAMYQDTIAKEWPKTFGIHDPISDALLEISLGSQGTLYSSSRAIAIGIEAIGNAVRLRNRYPSKAKSSLQIDSVIEYIRQWNGDETTRKFILDRLNNFKGPDFASCLYAFADANSIDHDVIKTWKNARHRLAHGTLEDTSQLSPDDERDEFQTNVHSYYSMLGLAYQMIADFIGYDGPLVDFSKPDWGIINND